ncbi:rhamnogalacturonan acetylesterase [Streptomyces sp. NPDC012769]|uniref:rhamnogalacturonan acetylesterase n=1 Tax=Streptomyces sp. NPDC012769 TaxID=3364848 RepID=UPI0036AFE737
MSVRDTVEPRPRALFIAGDSTASQKYADAAPETGWGMALPFFLDGTTQVVNHAINGRSTRTFLDEGRFDAVLAAIRPGDLLLVQFGHNDQSDDPTRHTDPWSTYQDNLRRYVEGARDRGAVPVLATPVERRQFDGSGTALRTLGAYPEAMREVAKETDVPLLDIEAASLALWRELGPEATKAYFHWTATARDNTHFGPRGAIAVARLVARALLGAGLLAPAGTRRLDDEVPVDRITWPAPVEV